MKQSSLLDQCASGEENEVLRIRYLLNKRINPLIQQRLNLIFERFDVVFDDGGVGQRVDVVAEVGPGGRVLQL